MLASSSMPSGISRKRALVGSTDSVILRVMSLQLIAAARKRQSAMIVDIPQLTIGHELSAAPSNVK